MNENWKSDEDVLVACEVCLSEIPASEAKNCEAVDYFIHFCGLECYEIWRAREVETETK